MTIGSRESEVDASTGATGMVDASVGAWVGASRNAAAAESP
jgi:hypothetical protein